MNHKLLLNGFMNLVVRRYAGPFWYRRHWLSKTQWYSEDQLKEMQWDLFKRILFHAYQNVPYYTDKMNRLHLKPADIKRYEDIEKLPILTKKDVFNAGNAMLSKRIPKCFMRKAHTGGTTGTPLDLYRTYFSIGNEHAFVRRQWDWAGLDFRDVCAYLKGRIIRSDKNYIYDPVMKELHLSTYQLNLESAKKYLKKIVKYKCKGLIGYPSSIFILAQAKNDMDIELPIKSILLTSETLTPQIRDFIAKSFGVNIYDFYGAAERVCYIFTCEKGSYHIQPEYGFTEMSASTSEEQKIISTGFWNYAMPLIRYDTGDKFKLSTKYCDCGRSFPTVEQICGREGDYIKTPSGKIFGVSILTHIFHVICGIDSFVESQIVQDGYDNLIVRYIPSHKFDASNIENYSQKLKTHIGQDINIEFMQVDNIEKTASGKHKFVISNI